MVSSADIFKVCGSDFLLALSISSNLIIRLLSLEVGLFVVFLLFAGLQVGDVWFGGH